jgi:lysophospholipase L1-like esterase
VSNPAIATSRALLISVCVAAAAHVHAQPASAPAAPPWPDPARLEADVRAIERADSTGVAPKRGAIVAYGSSSIRFWHPTIARDLSPLPIAPRGFGGSTMHDAVVYAPRLLLPLEPRAVLLYEGDNDIEAGVSPDAVRDEFLELLHTVRASRPDCRFYVLSIKPAPARWKYWDAARTANGQLRDACEAETLCTYVDVATPMLVPSSGRPRPELYLADSLHMTPKGYEVWRRVVRRALFRGEIDPRDPKKPGFIPGRMFDAPPSDVDADSVPAGKRVGALRRVDGERAPPARVRAEERRLGRDVRVDRARDLLEQRGAAADLLHVDRLGHAA